jgi:hypothetical protein
MKRLHYLVALMIVWFFLLYNIERLVEPINLASFVYGYTALCAMVLIGLPNLKRVPTLWLAALSLIPYLALKLQLGHTIAGQLLPITVTEMSAIVVTVLLSDAIGQRIERLRKTMTSLVVGQVGEEIQPFSTGQADIYREIRRARRHQRPLSLLAVSATEEPINLAPGQATSDIPLHRFLEEVQGDVMKKYVNTRLANLLVEEFEDTAVITQRDRHFVILLPETNAEGVADVLARLARAAEKKLRLQLKVGVSTFPDRAVTFETLLEQAETAMLQSPTAAASLADPMLSLATSHGTSNGTTNGVNNGATNGHIELRPTEEPKLSAGWSTGGQ